MKKKIKLTSEEQKQLKGLSKFIYVLARIAKVGIIIGLVGVIIGMSSFIFVTANTKIDTKAQEIEIFDTKINYKFNEDGLEIESKGESVKIFKQKELQKISSVEQIEKFLEAKPVYQVSLLVLLTVFVSALFVIVYIILKYLEMIFINIHNESTPFTMDNVTYLKKISLYMVICLIIPIIFDMFISLLYGLNLSISINIMNFVIIAIVYSLSYIFKYGYTLQLDAKGGIYDEK